MPLPDDMYDDDRNYRIRLCMKVSETLVVAKGSVIDVCDSCNEPIWVHQNMAIPPMPEGLECHGDLNICFACIPGIKEKSGAQEAKWLGPKPSDFGLSDPI